MTLKKKDVFHEIYDLMTGKWGLNGKIIQNYTEMRYIIGKKYEDNIFRKSFLDLLCNT